MRVCASARLGVRERVRGFGRQDLAARKTKWFVSDLFQRKCVNRHAWQSIAGAAQSARAGGQELADEADAAPHNDRRRLPVPEVGAGRRTRHPAGRISPPGAKRRLRSPLFPPHSFSMKPSTDKEDAKPRIR